MVKLIPHPTQPPKKTKENQNKMEFRNRILRRIYKYIYIHDGQTILIKDIAAETGYCRQTISKYLKWMERREILTRYGKKFELKKS